MVGGIYVRKTFPFKLAINPDLTVDELKQQIEETKQITPNLQRLIFRGRILKSNTKLKDYDISNGSTIHLVARKPTTNNQSTTTTQPQPQAPNPSSTSDASTNTNSNNNNNNNRPNTIPFIHQQQAAHINAIQQMFQNLNQAQQQAQVNGATGAIPVPMGAVPMPQMVFRRMQMNNSSVSNTVRNVYDNDDENETESKQNKIEIKQAEYSDENASSNLMKWKIRKTKIQKWISVGKKFQSYFSEEQELNNGSIWRFFVYPNGINQQGYQQDCVLFIMLEELPFGVDAMDVEFALHFKSCNINFKFRKTFNNFVRSTGWPRNFLLSQKIMELPSNKNFVKFTCDLIIHCVICNNGNKRMTNLEFIKWKKNDPKYGLIGYKPNGRLFRWKIDKKAFIDAQFKQYQQTKTWNVNGFKFYIHLYPNGLSREGVVQPYLHLIKMPYSVNKIDAHFSFYFREINVGYSHVDMFNGKIGKGWPDMKLKRDEVKWSDLKTITMDCRVNILNVSVNAQGWFTNENGEKIESKMNDNDGENKNDNDNEQEEKKKDNILVVKESEQEKGEKEFKNWLSEKVGLEEYFDNFIENEIHSLEEVVEYIEEKNNLKEIGIKAFGHRVKLWKCIVKLKEMMEMSNINDEASTF